MQKQSCLLNKKVNFLKQCINVRASHNLFSAVIINKSISEESLAKFLEREPEMPMPRTKGNPERNAATFLAVFSMACAFTFPSRLAVKMAGLFCKLYISSNR